METFQSFTENQVIVTWTLTEREIEILKKIESIGYLEYRISYIEKDRLDSSKSIKESEILDLINYDFIEQNYDAWHTEYKLTKLSKEYLNSLNTTLNN